MKSEVGGVPGLEPGRAAPAAANSGGRFGPRELNPRGTRGQLPDGKLPGHARLANWLEQPTDWDEEFEADLADLADLIEAKARRGRHG
jgi:hypothetical protein